MLSKTHYLLEQMKDKTVENFENQNSNVSAVESNSSQVFRDESYNELSSIYCKDKSSYPPKKSTEEQLEDRAENIVKLLPELFRFSAPKPGGLDPRIEIKSEFLFAQRQGQLQALVDKTNLELDKKGWDSSFSVKTWPSKFLKQYDVRLTSKEGRLLTSFQFDGMK